MAIGDMPLIQFEDLYDLTVGEYPNAYLEHKEIAESERNFINKLYNLFSDKRLAANEAASVVRVYRLMKEWWIGLPSVVKARNAYEPGVANIEKVLDIFEASAKTGKGFVSQYARTDAEEFFAEYQSERPSLPNPNLFPMKWRQLLLPFYSLHLLTENLMMARTTITTPKETTVVSRAVNSTSV